MPINVDPAPLANSLTGVIYLFYVHDMDSLDRLRGGIISHVNSLTKKTPRQLHGQLVGIDNGSGASTAVEAEATKYATSQGLEYQKVGYDDRYGIGHVFYNILTAIRDQSPKLIVPNKQDEK